MSSRNKHAQKCGWLHKRGGRIQTWHKRWFVLTGDMLFYYKTPRDSRPTGTIPLAGNNVVRHQDDPTHNAYRFEVVAGNGRNFISSTHESYLMSAETPEDADSWVAIINRVLHEPYGGGMFGRTLDDTMVVEGRLGGGYVPILVHRCSQFLLDKGIEETGIFRLPGQTSRIQALKTMYDQGSQAKFADYEDVHTIASLLKLYLRELPDPVIPFSLYEDTIKAARLIDGHIDEAMAEVKQLLQRMPSNHFNLLKYLCRFLYRVAESSEMNKMSHSNLATVFGPNIMRSRTSTPENLIESSNASSSFVCLLIRKQSELFPTTTDEKPPKRLSILGPLDMDIANIRYSPNKVTMTSLYNKSPIPLRSMKASDNRSRLGSVPARFSFHEKIMKKGKNAVLQSPRSSRKFTFSTTFDGNLTPEPPDTSSGRVSPILTHSPSFNEDVSPLTPVVNCLGHRIVNGVQSEKEMVIVDDFASPEHSSTSPTSEGEMRSRSSTMRTLSPDLLVNSIASEMENLEKQLQIAKDALAKKKNECRLWKARYDQERTARLAAEERITGLQTLVDQTFQQFALDDSEDEDYADDSVSLSGDSLLDVVSTTLMENGISIQEKSSSVPPPSLPSGVQPPQILNGSESPQLSQSPPTSRHKRALSTQ